MRDIFDPHRFREILDAPAQRAEFAAMFPHARLLFEEYLDSTPPVLAEFPADGVTALQFTLFDNGEEAVGHGKRMLTMKSRFGLNVKAWDRLSIDWRKSYQIRWEANACLRGSDETLKVVEPLTARSLLSHNVLAALEAVMEMAGNQSLFGVCHQRKPGMGSGWTDVIVHLRWDGKGIATGAFLIRPDLTGYEADVFEPKTATASPLGGNAVAQARVAYTSTLYSWASKAPNLI